MKTKKVLIIIPAYNEEKSILSAVDSIRDYNRTAKSPYDYLVINDGSTDSTESILREHDIPHVTLQRNLGIGGAVRTGYRHALKNDYDFAIQFDGDNQHDILCAEAILAPLRSDSADLVIGSRFVKGNEDNEFYSSFARRTGIKLLSYLMRFKTGHTVLDTTSGFRAANRRMIEVFARRYPTEYPEPISTTEALLDGFRVVEVPVKRHARTTGRSSIHGLKSIKYMTTVFAAVLTARKQSKRQKSSR